MAEWIRRLGGTHRVKRCRNAWRQAKRLGVAYFTPNTHTNAIYRKLQVNSRAQLILAYHRIVKHE